MTARPAIHPVLMALFPPLFLLAHNVSEANPTELLLPISLSLALAMILWAIAAAATRSIPKGAILATLALALFFSFAHHRAALDVVLTWLCDFWIRTDIQTPKRTMILIDLAILAFAGWVVGTTKRDLKPWTRGLNAFTVILVIVSLFQAAPAAWRSVNSRRSGGVTARRTEIELPLSSVGPRRPDIYYIVLDSFAREDVLQSDYGFDLAPFLNDLEKRGFYVAREARANYPQTPLCLASSLNLRYLDDPTMGHPQSLNDLKDLISENTVARSLRTLGYKFVSFASGFDPTDHPHSDLHLTAQFELSEFQRMLLDTTPASSLLLGSSDGDSFRLARARTLNVLDRMPSLALDPAPTFAFAHVLCPHPPFVFGADGEDVSPYGEFFQLTNGNVFALDARTPASYAESYRRQVAFLVKRVGRMVDAILANSPEPPVILLQSDHGPGLRLNIYDVKKTNLRERMSILNAYYLPESGRKLLYPGITPVNSFRVVLNSLFDARLPLLPDRSYFAPWGDMFAFDDVTERLRDDAQRRETTSSGAP